jgi:UDP-N-acetylbacillosamine N-acetyltransferase
MSTPSGLLIVGYGGHARSIADVALALGIPALKFLEPTASEGEQFLGFPVCPALDGDLPSGWKSFAAAGDGAARREQMARISTLSWPVATLVAPSATVGVGALLGPGCLIGHHAHVGPLARLGAGCIVNTGAIVEHDCRVGDYTHVSVNATVAGGCRIGSSVFLGAGSIVVDKCTVADGIRVGAGAVVIESLTRPGTYVGVPARQKRSGD